MKKKFSLEEIFTETNHADDWTSKCIEIRVIQ